MVDKGVWFDYLKSTLRQLCPQWNQPISDNYNYLKYTDDNYLDVRGLNPDGHEFKLWESDLIVYGVDVDGIKFLPNQSNEKSWKLLLRKLAHVLFPGSISIDMSIRYAMKKIDWTSNPPPNTPQSPGQTAPAAQWFSIYKLLNIMEHQLLTIEEQTGWPRRV